MNKPNYEIFITQDGSPTLQWLRADGYGEKMHHSGGALSESLFIYQEALQLTLAQGWPPRILSLGLGLGYNELIAAGTLLKAGCQDWKIWSYELQDFLRQQFITWLNGEAPELANVYDAIAHAISTQLSIVPSELKSTLAQARADGRFELRGAFPQDAGPVGDCTCVFYDAFSKKMDPQLWEETLLTQELGPRLARQCVLSTYAATGSLNRALKTLGFRLLPRPGFQGKRESTLAIRD